MLITVSIHKHLKKKTKKKVCHSEGAKHRDLFAFIQLHRSYTCKTTPKRSTAPPCCQYRMEAEDSLGRRKAVSKIRTLKKRRYLGNREGPSAKLGKHKGNEGRGGGMAARLSLNSCSLPLLGRNLEQVHC